MASSDAGCRTLRFSGCGFFLRSDVVAGLQTGAFDSFPSISGAPRFRLERTFENVSIHRPFSWKANEDV
jgi:hypothetical protein